VTHAAEGHVVHQLLRTRQVVDREVAERRHAHDRGTTLAGGAALAVAAGRVRVGHAGVHDEQLEGRRREAEFDDVGLERPAVEEDPRVALAEEGRHLIHDPGGGADGLVLGASPRLGERHTVEAEPPDVVQGRRRRALDRRRRRQARADGHVG